MTGVTGQGDRILVTPFDPANVPAVVKTLTEAKLNAYVLNSRSVAVSVPPNSGERRAEIARHVKKLVEEVKVAARLAICSGAPQRTLGGDCLGADAGRAQNSAPEGDLPVRRPPLPSRSEKRQRMRD